MKIETPKSIVLSFCRNGLKTLFTAIIAVVLPLCSYAQENPVLVCLADQAKNTDMNNCIYTVQGTELDPVSVTDNNNQIASLNYSLRKMMPNPNLITENFNNASWNAANFEIGSPSGSASTGAYKSLSDADRGTLRTVNNFVPTAQNPLHVTARLTFAGSTIAFIGTRSTGLKVGGASNEPSNSLYLRIHNFNDGQTNITPAGFETKPGNSFYANPVIVHLVDNGSSLAVTMTNTVTNQVRQFSANSNYSSGSNRIVFSGNAYWDDIKISLGPHEYVQEFAAGSNSLAGVAFAPGETTVVWIATDEEANTGNCSFKLTVGDTQSPTISAAGNISGSANTSLVNFQTTIPDAVISDNCANPVLTWVMTGATVASGNGQVGTRNFAPGVTTITYTLKDGSGNIATDSLTVTNTFVPFSGGSGTIEDPYQLSTLADLRLLCQVTLYRNRFFVITNDIDASQTQYWDDNDDNADGDRYNDPNDATAEGSNNGFRPITNFSGQIDGQYHTIEDLTIKRSGEYESGFIAQLGGSIKALELTNIKVNSAGYAGGLVGYNYGNINECAVSGSLNANEYSGGLVGINDGYINNSFSKVAVSGNYGIGGLAGLSYGSTTKSYSTGTVAFVDFGGGLIAEGSINSDSFWDMDASNQATSEGGGTGKTTAEMKAISTFTAAGWDFAGETSNGSGDIWDMNSTYNEGYPFFAKKLTVTWTGATDTQWEVASNWSRNEVPVSDSYVIIPEVANQPVINSDVEIQKLTLSADAELSVRSNLTIKGDFENNGVVIFKSDAVSTGHFGKFNGTISGSGTATVERYLPAKRAWRALTAPLKGSNGSLFATWQNNGAVVAGTGAEIWGPSGTGIATGPSYSALEYTASGYVNVTNTQTKNLFETNKNNAYLVFVTGAYGSNNIANGTAEATTLKATGSLITGDVSHAGIISTRHTMIGNPYASALNPAELLDNTTNLIDKFWVWDPNLGASGGYVMFDDVAGTYNNLTGSYPTATTAIQSGQAFFVRATTGNTGSITLTENNKITAFTNNTFSSEALEANSNTVPEIVRLGMYKQQGQDWMSLDGAIAVLYPSANPEVDVKDGRKFANTSENLAFRRNNISLSSEHHLPLVAQDTLSFRVWNTTASTYKLHINTESFTTTGLVAKLQDLYANTETVVNLDGSILEYQFDVTTDANSTNDRFRIVFQEAASLAIGNPATTPFIVAPNPITDKTIRIHFDNQQANYGYKLVNTLGQIVASGEVSAASGATIKVENVASGWYGLQLEGEDKKVTTVKVIIK